MQNDFGTGKIWKIILAQSVPLMFAQLVHLLYNVVPPGRHRLPGSDRHRPGLSSDHAHRGFYKPVRDRRGAVIRDRKRRGQ